MAIIYVYEPQYNYAGWFDDGGRSIPSWLDDDLVEDVPKTLAMFEPGFFLDDDVIFLLQGPGTSIPGIPDGTLGAGITVGLTSAFFDDKDLFFIPASVRALDAPDEMLKNEVRRLR